MKIPKSVRIGGHDFKIRYPAKLKGMYGHITYRDKHEIAISAGANAECTFWHEVLHGIDWVYNNGCSSEKSIERLAHGIYQVMNELEK